MSVAVAKHVHTQTESMNFLLCSHLTTPLCLTEATILFQPWTLISTKSCLGQIRVGCPIQDQPIGLR